MDYNYNEEPTLNIVNTVNLGIWHGDSRSCEQGQVIYQCPTITRPININEIDNMADNKPITVKDISTHQQHQPVMSSETDNQPIKASETNQSNDSPEKHNQPIRFSFANSQTIRSSLSSSSDSSDSSKTTTWGQVKLSSPTKSKKDSKPQNSNNSPNQSPTKNKNENRNMTSWKDVSPTKSSSSSDLEHSNHSNQSNEYANNRIFRFSNRMKDFNESSSSSDLDPGNQGQQGQEMANKDNSVTNQKQEGKCNCKNSPNGGSPCKKSCNCSKKCISHIPDNKNILTNSNTSLNENGSPKRDKALTTSPDELCDNDYYYEDEFTVQFDTNLRETSVTPIDSDPNTTILDFPNMVTGSYLCFNNGGSSNVSFNNSKADSNLSLNNLKASNCVQPIDDNERYDSELSGNSGSRNSTMEMSSSERDMMGSSDIIDFSDGPLFTPTPTHILSTDSLDKNPPEPADGEMSGSNGSGETNLNIDCCPKKEEYFLSFDGSHSRVSGSDTDVSLSFTSHDSCHLGQWSSHDSAPQQNGAHFHDRNSALSSMEGQEETSDSFHICFNKLSPQHKKHQLLARDNLSGRVLKLVPLKETIVENGDSSEDENTRTSPTLTAGTGTGSKDLSTLSPQGSPKKKIIKPQPEVLTKIKSENTKKRIHKSENLYLVGIGKPMEILRKAAVHSHTLPTMKNLVSWKQVKGSKAIRKGESCMSLPELSSSTTWQNIAGLKCRKLSEVSDSFHSKRHSASLLEFYQRMKSQSNPASPETMNNLEQIIWPNFIGQKSRQAEMSDSSSSSQECVHCQCNRQPPALSSSVTKAYTNKRIFDWLKMECSSSSRDSNRPNSLACQTANFHECSSKETVISPQTVTLWCGTKTVGSQFPPATKESGSQTFNNYQGNCIDLGLDTRVGKKDQSLQTSDFEEEEILSILSDNFDEFNFLKSNEGTAKDVLSGPENLFLENDTKYRIHRSKSVDENRQHEKGSTERQSRFNYIGRSKSTGRLGNKSESPMRRMGFSHHYSHQSLPDIAFLTSSVTLEKEESKESLFDPLKLDLPVPVTVATKTELEQFNIYQQKTSPCQHHCVHKSTSDCCDKNKGQKGQTESGSSSSGIFTSSASSGADTGFCECRSRSTTSPQNDLERLIFFPPHTEQLRKAKSCCSPKRRAQSMPNKLSDCANNTDLKIDKYANEIHPKARPGSKSPSQGQGRINQKWNNTNKNKIQIDSENGENLYALEEEQTPVASPERPCCHGNSLNGNCCQGDEDINYVNGNKCNYFSGERDFTDSDFYREVGKDNIIIVENDICYRGVSMGIDSTSSSGSSVPNSDRKPLKSCLRKRNRALRSRSLSAADNLNLDFDDMDEKIKNRHSYACDEVYIVSDEHGQLMMYQADDSAEPVMFYLGKDGECHMTEGTKTHLENVGNVPNFDIQAADSIHGSDSSTEREGSNKRKSVSFASEVSFQSISPAISPRKQATGTESSETGETEGDEMPKDSQTGDIQDCVKGETNETTEKETASVAIDTTESQDSGATQVGGFPDDQANTSSYDSPPEEFMVTMDTNDNIWSEDVMLEKIALLMAVSKASDYLITHFAKSVDTFDKLRLGNTSETPEIGDIVMTKLCPALSIVIGSGLKHHLAGFQMFGRVQVTVWKMVEASVEIVPQTRAVSDLVAKVKQTTFLTTHQQKFGAFIFGLLNLRLLDFWMGYIQQKEEHLAKFYEADAILVHSNSTLKKHYDDMVVAIQPLAVLPFQMNPEFIKEKALTDSKLKSQDLIGSKEGITGQTANQSAGNINSQVESTNESASSEVSSVLELTATKALNWLANATFSKKKPTADSQDSESKSKSLTFDSTNQMTDSDSTANQISSSFSFNGDEKDLLKPTKSSADLEKLTEPQQKLYCDAKISSVDCDPIISPTESMRSSQSSLSSMSSNVVQKGESTNTTNQSLTQSMTNSASSLVSKIMQFGANLAPKQQTTYKKGVTEYSFEGSESPQNSEVHKMESQKTANEKSDAEGLSSRADVEEVKLRVPKSDKAENRNSKRVSFDIVNLFDKLLLPSGGQKTAKPVSRIPVPTNRWSWSFGSSKPAVTASPTKVTKTVTKSDPEISKREHFPKKNLQSQSEKAKGQTKSPKTDKRAGSKTTPPPKPPRVVSGSSRDKKDTTVCKSESASLAKTVRHSVNNNRTATL